MSFLPYYITALVFLTGTIPLATSYYTGNSGIQGKTLVEQCWAKALDCGHWSGDGFGLRSRFCWERCQCKGYRSGACHRNRACERTTPKRPWKCQCWNKITDRKLLETTNCDPFRVKSL